MRRPTLLAIASLLALAGGGCGGRATTDGPVARADRVAVSVREAGAVVVPERDSTPPTPEVRLGGVSAGRGDPWPTTRLSLSAPLVATVTGVDRDGGMGRARVSVEAHLACRAEDGRRWRAPFVRHFPPSAVGRIRVTPGTRVRTSLRARALVQFGRDACGGARLERATGMVWADITNASGLDATSSHIRFRAR
jgi:hypothetical protein